MIAKLFGVSHQAVAQFYHRNIDMLQALKDFDSAMASRLKAKAIEIVDSIDSADIKKASLSQKGVVTGIFIEKYRLLTDQSTSNLAIESVLRHAHQGLFRSEKAEKAEKVLDGKISQAPASLDGGGVEDEG